MTTDRLEVIRRNPKFNFGDKVKLKEDLIVKEKYQGIVLLESMVKLKGQELTIANREPTEYQGECCYVYQFSLGGYYYSEEMIEKIQNK